MYFHHELMVDICLNLLPLRSPGKRIKGFTIALYGRRNLYNNVNTRSLILPILLCLRSDTFQLWCFLCRRLTKIGRLFENKQYSLYGWDIPVGVLPFHFLETRSIRLLWSLFGRYILKYKHLVLQQLKCAISQNRILRGKFP